MPQLAHLLIEKSFVFFIFIASVCSQIIILFETCMDCCWLWLVDLRWIIKYKQWYIVILRFDWLTGNGIWAHILLTTIILADTRQRNHLGAQIIQWVIPLAIVGYEIVIANEARTISCLTRARGIIVKYITMVFHIKSFQCSYFSCFLQLW